MIMAKRKAGVSKENVDPDLVDFREPRPKKAKAGSSSHFAAPLSEVEVAEYSKGPGQLYRTPQRIHNGLFVCSPCGVPRETRRILRKNVPKTYWKNSHPPSD